MNVREEFERAFGDNALRRPLFYRYPGGIRFELSEGGSTVDQFLTALGKAQLICDSAFQPSQSLTVVLSVRSWGSRFSHRGALRDFHAAGVTVPRERCLWTEPSVAGMPMDGDDAEIWICLAFQAPRRCLRNLLWCALSGDLCIKPSPGAAVFLANLDDGILVFPYDDRGMDVVGPNHQRLAELYAKFRPLTLEFDREQMEATFVGAAA